MPGISWNTAVLHLKTTAGTKCPQKSLSCFKKAEQSRTDFDESPAFESQQDVQHSDCHQSTNLVSKFSLVQCLQSNADVLIIPASRVHHLQKKTNVPGISLNSHPCLAQWEYIRRATDVSESPQKIPNWDAYPGTKIEKGPCEGLCNGPHSRPLLHQRREKWMAMLLVKKSWNQEGLA